MERTAPKVAGLQGHPLHAQDLSLHRPDDIRGHQHGLAILLVELSAACPRDLSLSVSVSGAGGAGLGGSVGHAEPVHLAPDTWRALLIPGLAVWLASLLLVAAGLQIH